MVDPDMERKDGENDEEVGVAVVFDEEEDDEAFEIGEESDAENEEVDEVEGKAEVTDDGDEELVIGGASSKGTQGKTKTDKDMVSPHAIDDFWVQRQISEVYPDQLPQPTKPRLFYPF